MKLIALLLALALPACATVPSSPAAVANATVLDEQAALSVELAYQAAATALLTANNAGLIPAAAKAKVRAADTRAYAAVQVVRATYNAGNAADYATTVIAARQLISELLTAIKG